MRILLLLAASFGYASAQEAPPAPDLTRILSRVAENQALAQEQRKEWVYTQKQLLAMHRGSGKLAREERREYSITPKGRRVQKELVHFEGKYENHGKILTYDRPGYGFKGMDIDGDLINSLSDDLTNDKDSRDGLDHDLFPLVRDEQKKYDFRLEGTQEVHGRPTFRLTFKPKPHPADGDSGSWKGEALIDAEEFQPVRVTTSLAFPIPMAVRILLGTNIKGLGFTVSYQRFADGVWFPVSYGGEFDVRAVFFYKRTISLALTNSDFRRTDVSTKVAYSIEDK
ncbi:MAG TPA: hypothetical protein VKU19_17255 [Bryobacteraceae bacterium]|nr:hypothetical protein [Bryobacteraceae bacterium]